MEKGKAKNILCPICGRYTFANRADYDICPFCDWENDELYGDNGICGANHISYKEALQNYQKNGWIYSEPFTLDSDPLTEQKCERYFIAKTWYFLLHSRDLNDLRVWYYKKYSLCLQGYVDDRHLPSSEMFMNWLNEKAQNNLQRKNTNADTSSPKMDVTTYHSLLDAFIPSVEMRDYLKSQPVLHESTLLDIIIGSPVPLSEKAKWGWGNFKKAVKEALMELTLQPGELFTLTDAWYDEDVHEANSYFNAPFLSFDNVVEHNKNMRGSSYFCQVKSKRIVPGYNDKTRKYIRGSVVNVEFVNEKTGKLEKDNIWVDAFVCSPEHIIIDGYYSVFRAKNGYVLELFEYKEPNEAFRKALLKSWEA